MDDDSKRELLTLRQTVVDLSLANMELGNLLLSLYGMIVRLNSGRRTTDAKLDETDQSINDFFDRATRRTTDLLGRRDDH